MKVGVGVRTLRRARRLGALAVGASVAVTGALVGTATGPSAAATGSLRTIACTTLRSDIPLEAPLYAQKDGASAATDGWWCQLPHATKVPSGYVEQRRLQSPLLYPYGLYSTYYGPKSNSGQTFTPGDKGMEVTVDWNSTVQHAPSHLVYPKALPGRRVALGKGIAGNIVKAKHDESVTWRFPAHGVPKYLVGVVRVTVTGFDEPLGTVLAVARSVKPN